MAELRLKLRESGSRSAPFMGSGMVGMLGGWVGRWTGRDRALIPSVPRAGPKEGSRACEVAYLTISRFDVVLYCGLGLLPSTFLAWSCELRVLQQASHGKTGDLEGDVHIPPRTPSSRNPKSRVSRLHQASTCVMFGPRVSLKMSIWG